ncbi:MAG: HEAT repeat domain-containing protein [Planctomycetota bacterium]|nr:HEAT repeat domain-containing protein [Planctomycetota bacterium]
MGKKEYIKILHEVMLKDRSKYVKIAAAEAIAKIGGSTANESLTEGLQKSKSYYQAKTFIAASLGYVGSVEPIDDIMLAASSENKDVRASAAWALAYLIGKRMRNNKKYKNLLEEFVTMIKSESDDIIRRDMAMGFIMMPTEEIVETIHPFLVDQRSKGVRKIAALALGMSGSPAVVEVLAGLETDEDPAVEKARGYALALLATADSHKLVLDMFNETEDDEILASAILNLAMTEGEENYRDIYNYNRHKSDTDLVLRTVCFALPAFLGESGFRQAMRFIRSRNDVKSTMTYLGLGILNTKEANSAIDNFAKGATREVTKVVRIGKGLMGGLPLINTLTEAIDDPKVTVRSAAIIALGSLNRPEQIDKLMKLAVDDNNPRVRGYAIGALANMQVPPQEREKVVNTLVGVLKDDKNRFPRAYAAFILSKFPESRKAFEAVRTATHDKDSDVQAMAAISIGLFGNPAGAKDIKYVMNRGRGTPLAYSAYIGFGLLRYKAMLSKFIADFKYAQHEEEFIALGFAISRAAEKDTYVKVLEYIDSDDIYARENAIKAIGMFENLTDEERTECVEKLAELADDSDMVIRFYSGLVRYAFGDKKAMKLILKTVVDNQFYMPGMVDIKYDTAMNLVNDIMPMYYKLKPYFWGDEDSAVN